MANANLPANLPTVSAMLSIVQQALIAKLAGVQSIGASVKPLPADLELQHVQRTAMCMVVANSIQRVGKLGSDSPLQTSAGSRLRATAWVVVVGFELNAPRGVLWLASEVESALDMQLLALPGLHVDATCYAGQLQFTSSKGGLYQYRLSLDIDIPWTTTPRRQTNE